MMVSLRGSRWCAVCARGLFLMVVVLGILLGAGRSAWAIPNPAAAYAERLGYEYKTVDTAAGKKGVVVVSPGVEFDAEDFYRGKVGSEYSYGALFGYETMCETRDMGTYVAEYAVCVRQQNGETGSLTANDAVDRIPMLDLMERNGEPLVEGTMGTMEAALADPTVGFGPEVYQTGITSSRSYPTSFSWTNYNGHTYIGPVRDQGSCGSCYSFGANAAAEGVYNKANNLYDGNCVDFSESFIIWCLGSLSKYNSHFFGCRGADYDYQELLALTVEGVCSEADFPYQESEPSSCTHWSDPVTTFSSWHRVACGDIDAIKDALMTHGVVDAAVSVSSSFSSYSGGIYRDSNTDCSSSPCYYTPTDHAISLVGWNDNGGDGYWILRNSWGTSWGENGYMRISYNSALVACEVACLTYSNASAPSATTVPATGVLTDSAMLNGTVNPNGQSTVYWFEYGTSRYSLTTPPVSVGSGSGPVAVSNLVSSLSANTLYHFRIVASNSAGVSEGADRTFTTQATAPEAPVVTTDPADRIGSGAAQLNGEVTPRGAATVYWFEYGTTTNYGDTTGSASSGSGWSAVGVSNEVTGLSPTTIYHYRLVASNSVGKTVGADRQFTTLEVSDTLLAEDFEDGGSMPAGWTQDEETGSTAWTFRSGSESGTPGTPHGGSYNANLYKEDYTPSVTKLVTPMIDFGTHTNDPTLTFWHVMPDWDGDQDELRVYYRTSSGGAWTQIAVYNSDVSSWTERTLSLPNPSGSYYIAFEGTAQYGYGICIDDVEVTAKDGGTPLPPPDVTTQPAGPVGDTTATLNGSVNPNGSATVYWFEYGTGVPYSSTTTPNSAGSGTVVLSVSNAVAGLSGGVLYHFRVVATNANGQTAGSDRTFTTTNAPSAPTATTDPASLVGSQSALLNATVNPNGALTTCWFEYGTNGIFSWMTGTFSAGEGTAPGSVSNLLTGLDPETTYDFRVVASNSAGVQIGSSRQFTTLAQSSALLEEDFEHGGAAPSGWQQVYVNGSIDWSYENGGGEDGSGPRHPTAAHGGSYNALLFSDTYTDRVTRLITPAINFGTQTNDASLTFWHAMDNWYSDVDELRVYYKTSASGSWTLLATYTTAESDWVERTLSLPNPSSEYYIAFEGALWWGYGVCIDDVSVSAQVTPGSPPTVTTEAATAILTDSAMLNGTVNPNGVLTTYWFEYGTGVAYGATTPSSSAGVGTSTIGVSNWHSSLKANTEYHYRTVASNSAGISYGADRSFTTLAASSGLLTEDFEHGGAAPSGWTLEYESRTRNWAYADGGAGGSPASAHGGNYNALFYIEAYTEPVTKLVSPEVIFGAQTNEATLTFWHCQADWMGDQDELRVYYRTSSGGSWQLLATYTSDVGTWTKRTLPLPDPTSTYYIAFEGTAKYGYGVCVDDVEITATGGGTEPPPEVVTPPSVTGNDFVIQWSCLTNKQYTVYCSTNLMLPPFLLATNLTGHPPANSFTDTIDNVGHKIYWIQEDDP